MRLRNILAIVWLCQDAVCGRAQGGGPTKPLRPPRGAIAEATAWAAAHAFPLATCEPGNGFTDLQPLNKLIGNRPVVAIGEGLHDTHEHLAFRNRLFEFLVEQMGFTAIAVETGYSESVAADDYVLGRGVNRRKAATAVFSWEDTPTLDSMHYCVGDSRLTLSNGTPNASVRLLGTSNGQSWEIPAWRRTNGSGVLGEEGQFAAGTEGSHTLRVEVGGVLSNAISFVVANCNQ